MPLKKTLTWTTTKGTEMSADLYYRSWWDKIEKMLNPACTDFVEWLHVEFFVGKTPIGTMDDETINGCAVIRLFERDGKIICTVDDEGYAQLIVFDGLDFLTVERAWDTLAEAYDPEIYQLRQQYRLQAKSRVPEIHYY
jgi:hypothetical protein